MCVGVVVRDGAIPLLPSLLCRCQLKRWIAPCGGDGKQRCDEWSCYPGLRIGREAFFKLIQALGDCIAGLNARCTLDLSDEGMKGAVGVLR